MDLEYSQIILLAVEKHLLVFFRTQSAPKSERERESERERKDEVTRIQAEIRQAFACTHNNHTIDPDMNSASREVIAS